MPEPRYFVDERSGCIAVRDRENTDPEYNGLHSDTEGVVKFWHGRQVKKVCSECGHHYTDGWEISAHDKTQAILLCAELNATASQAAVH